MENLGGGKKQKKKTKKTTFINYTLPPKLLFTYSWENRWIHVFPQGNYY